MWKHEIVEYLANPRKSPNCPLGTVIDIHKYKWFNMGEHEKFQNLSLDPSVLNLPYDYIAIEFTDYANVGQRVSCRNIVFAHQVKSRIEAIAFISLKSPHCYQYGFNDNEWMLQAVGLSGNIEANDWHPFVLGDDNPSQEIMDEIATATLRIVLILCNLLACKNVTAVPVDPPERLNKKRIKKGKEPLYRYHVLTVDTSMGRKKTDGGPVQNAGIMPVHLCRGHFKEYTEAAPLFGRITGKFWWQPHARGSAKNGIVDKDYSIKTGEAV